MDPELKALLRGMKPGSREYQATVNKYMAEKAGREGAAADRNARLQREQADAEAQRQRQRESQEAEIRAREQAAQQERDQRTSLVTAGAAGGGLASGFIGGKYADTVANKRADSVLSGRATEVRNAARAARAVNPNSGAAAGQYADIARGVERTGALRPRVLPVGTAGIGATMLGLGAYSNFERAPNAKSDTERALWTGAGYGEMGAGAKMLVDSARRYANPGVTLPAADVAAIEGAARMGAGGKIGPVAPAETADPYTISKPQADASEAPKAPDAARMAELRAKRAADLKTEAKAMGLHVSGTKEDLARRIAEAGQQPMTAAPKGRLPRGKSGILLPLAAGAMAYDATTGEAEAAGVDPINARRRGVMSGAAAAAGTAAVPYAISKLPEAVGRAANAGGPGFAPSTVDAMTDYSPDDLAQGRNMLARYLPSGLRGGAVEDAYQMAQVPERNPERNQLAAVNERSEQGNADFDAHLAAFMQAVEEHYAGVGGQEYGP